MDWSLQLEIAYECSCKYVLSQNRWEDISGSSKPCVIRSIDLRHSSCLQGEAERSGTVRGRKCQKRKFQFSCLGRAEHAILRSGGVFV